MFCTTRQCDGRQVQTVLGQANHLHDRHQRAVLSPDSSVAGKNFLSCIGSGMKYACTVYISEHKHALICTSTVMTTDGVA